VPARPAARASSTSALNQPRVPTILSPGRLVLKLGRQSAPQAKKHGPPDARPTSEEAWASMLKATFPRVNCGLGSVPQFSWGCCACAALPLSRLLPRVDPDSAATAPLVFSLAALDPSGLARGGFSGKGAIVRLDSLTVSIYLS
jgi:hypothetical protein